MLSENDGTLGYVTSTDGVNVAHSSTVIVRLFGVRRSAKGDPDEHGATELVMAYVPRAALLGAGIDAVAEKLFAGGIA